MRIEWDACARIVAQECRRFRDIRIGGYISSDDLSQELSIAALRSARQHDGRDNAAYIRTSVRNAIRTLYERVYAAKRYPQDRYGRPIPLASFDFVEPQSIKQPNPEETTANREQLRLIASQLCSRDKDEFVAYATGKKEIDPQFVQRIRSQLDLSSK